MIFTLVWHKVWGKEPGERRQYNQQLDQPYPVTGLLLSSVSPLSVSLSSHSSSVIVEAGVGDDVVDLGILYLSPNS